MRGDPEGAVRVFPNARRCDVRHGELIFGSLRSTTTHQFVEGSDHGSDLLCLSFLSEGSFSVRHDTRNNAVAELYAGCARSGLTARSGEL